MEKKRILIVEEELCKPIEDNALLILLDDNGIEYDIAETGAEAFGFLEKNRYDMICLDIMLEANNEGKAPKLPADLKRVDVGVYILEKLRSGAFELDGAAKDTPVVVVSAVTGYERRKKIIKLLKKEEYYIQKPTEPKEIFKAIKNILGLS